VASCMPAHTSVVFSTGPATSWLALDHLGLPAQDAVFDGAAQRQARSGPRQSGRARQSRSATSSPLPWGHDLLAWLPGHRAAIRRGSWPDSRPGGWPDSRTGGLASRAGWCTSSGPRRAGCAASAAPRSAAARARLQQGPTFAAAPARLQQGQWRSATRRQPRRAAEGIPALGTQQEPPEEPSFPAKRWRLRWPRW
jgi:hypothetical protein